MTNILPNDVCRCNDTDCPKHNTCQRWTQRMIAAADPVSLVQCASLYDPIPFCLPPDECGYYIHDEECEQ
jgi:hypothetical protein